jgi:hypothetical protein
MDFMSERPMPSLDERIAKLLTYVENPGEKHKEIAREVASKTVEYSWTGYYVGQLHEQEKRDFLARVTESSALD